MPAKRPFQAAEYSSRQLFIFLPTFLMALFVYVTTAAPDLTWANFGVDGGELITAAVTLGVAHPPGYPTYVLLGKLASYFPAGTIAYRFNLFSALALALAAGFVALTTSQLLQTQRARHHGLVSLATGLTFAWAPLVWSQALITEVYALNGLAVAILVWCLVSKRPGWLIGLCLGLSLTTHPTSLFMAPFCLWLVPAGSWRPLLVGCLAGLAPYLALPLLAQSQSPVVWGDPTTVDGWAWLVSGRLYRPNMFAIGGAALWERAVLWLKLLPSQFTWPGLVLLAAGIGQVLKTSSNERRLLVVCLVTATFYTLFSLTYAPADSIILTIPVFLLLSIPLAIGLQHTGNFAILLPLTLLLIHFPEQNLSQERSTRPLVSLSLQAAPVNAILETPGDKSVFTLWYWHHVEGIRGDVILVDSNLFAFDWYRHRLGNLYPALAALETDNLKEFRRANGQQRPYCQLSLASSAPVLDCND